MVVVKRRLFREGLASAVCRCSLQTRSLMQQLNWRMLGLWEKVYSVGQRAREFCSFWDNLDPTKDTWSLSHRAFTPVL